MIYFRMTAKHFNKATANAHTFCLSTLLVFLFFPTTQVLKSYASDRLQELLPYTHKTMFVRVCHRTFGDISFAKYTVAMHDTSHACLGFLFTRQHGVYSLMFAAFTWPALSLKDKTLPHLALCHQPAYAEGKPVGRHNKRKCA